jgi:DNA-binding response OmpR family regulator
MQMQTVLLFTDESASYGSIAALLSNCGYRVIQAVTATEVFILCEVYDVDLVLMGSPTDESDPASRMRLQFPRTVVAYMSGYDNLSVISKGHQALQEELWTELEMIALPIGPTALIRRVRNLLSDCDKLDSQSTITANGNTQETDWMSRAH